MGTTVGNTSITFNDATTQSTAAVPAATALNATGSAPLYACRAWVNFNGTGTVAIRASGNVSSITDNGVGDYTVNFTNTMPDANYSMSGAVDWTAGNEGLIVVYRNATTLTASAIRIGVGVPGTNGGTAIAFRDAAVVFVNIHR